ncbi:L,D-transpeptidase [Saccharopolyspora gloriosae]|uniref:L,D-transpeptidase n=1 Tax=Saccharopolyspora gloriosae TaxID=455344 RepID=UPI001FB7F0C4|nr:L,D-transpeptidase [Saccharopolyspora gloriosae]
MTARTRSARTAPAQRRALGCARSSLLAGGLAALLAGCGGGALPPAPAAETAAPAPVGQADRVDLTGLPTASTFGDLADAVADPAPQAATDGVVLRIERDVAVHRSPGGPAFARLPATQLGNPTWVPLIARHGDWAQILLPSRPNNSSGWIRVGPADPVTQARTPYHVDVDVDAKRLVVRESGRDIGTWTVGVGSTDAPTPRGRTYLMAAIEETVTKFSPIILPLGTHSETFNSYGGGPGTVALHGWPDPAVFGEEASDGCVRVPPDALRLLSTLPLGTVVSLH